MSMYIPKQRISIIEDDNLVLIDGIKIEMDVSSYIDADVWAIHWDVVSSKGEIEYNSRQANRVITNVSRYQKLIDIACKKVTALVDEEAEQLAWLNSYAYQKVEKLTSLTTIAQRFVDEVVGVQYPNFEKLTFETQKQEAIAWSNDPTVSTPNVDLIARNRGIDRDVLLQKVLAKSGLFQAISMSIAGQRQAFEDRINATETVEQLNAIDIEFTLPE